MEAREKPPAEPDGTAVTPGGRSARRSYYGLVVDALGSSAPAHPARPTKPSAVPPSPPDRSLPPQFTKILAAREQQTINVRVREYEVKLPVRPPDRTSSGDVAELDELVTQLYLLGGWDLIDRVFWQVFFAALVYRDKYQFFGAALENPTMEGMAAAVFGKLDDLGAPDLGHSAPQTAALGPGTSWYVLVAARLRLLVRPTPLDLAISSHDTASALALLESAVEKLREACLRLSVHIASRLSAIEQKAMILLDTQLADSEGQVIDEAQRYFNQVNDPRMARAALKGQRATLEVDDSKDGSKALRAAIEALRGSAQTVIDADAARRAQRKTLETQRQFLTPDSDLLKDLEKAARALTGRYDAALAAYALERSTRAAALPILHRLSPSHTLAAQGASVNKLAEILWPILALTLEARTRMIAFAAAYRRHAFQTMVPTMFDRPETVAAEADASVWKHRPLIDRALRALFASDSSVEYRAASDTLAAYAERRKDASRAELAQAVAEVALVIAATVVAPPVGFALDAALSARDLYDAVGNFDATSAQARFVLNSRDALIETDLSKAGIVLAVAGMMLTVVTPPPIVKAVP